MSTFMEKYSSLAPMFKCESSTTATTIPGNQRLELWTIFWKMNVWISESWLYIQTVENLNSNRDSHWNIEFTKTNFSKEAGVSKERVTELHVWFIEYTSQYGSIICHERPHSRSSDGGKTGQQNSVKTLWPKYCYMCNCWK